MMPDVRRPIEPADFGAIPRIRVMIDTLPKEIRMCPEHGREVTIEEGPSSANIVAVADFKKADWVGCCGESIDRVIKGVHKNIELIDRAKRTYRDELAGQLEPEHTGEIVAIELETGDHFLGEDEVEATDKARAAGHDGSLFFLRVGSPYAHRLMTPRRRCELTATSTPATSR
jgi:hypothetical protein